MKRTSFVLACAMSLTAVSFAQTSSSCVDLPSSLSRGMENKNVLALQNFLYAQGYLKATPNGYFGPGTFAAVKALQKSAGYSQVGIAGPATRAYIKIFTCTGQAGQTMGNPQASSTGTQQITYTAGVPLPAALKPQLDSVDLVTLFAGGYTEWGFDLHGSSFSSTTNMVYFKNLSSGVTYTIGTFGSADGTTITLPTSIGSTKFSCGNGCLQSMPAGPYEIFVQTSGGQTSGKYIEIKPFTIQSRTGSEMAPLPSTGSNVKLGTLTFSTSLPVIVKSVGFAVSASTISADGVGTVSYNDVMRGSLLAQDAEAPAFQTMIIDAQVSTSNLLPGTLTGFFMVIVEDYVGKRSTKFFSPEFLVTVEGTL